MPYFNLLLLPISLLLLFTNSCKQNNPNIGNNNSLPPVEQKPPNTSYKPAFINQTRAPGMKTTTAIDAKAIANSLSSPWGIVTLPNGQLLISEKEGTLRIATTMGNISSPITGLPAVNSNGQGGLLDIAISPDFNSDRLIYFVFSENYESGTLTSVGKGKLSDDSTKMESVSIIYRAIPSYNGTLHYGGRLLFDRKGNLYLSTGERSDLATRPLAQLVDNALGKIIYIDTDGKSVTGAPFVSVPGALKEIYTYGHRNTQSIAFHPKTGDLWQAEMGPRGGDELNLIQPGKNYGWPIITYGIEYSGSKIGDGITQKDGMEQPVYYWDPVISPSGMIFYDSDTIPEWKNDLFIGCLSGQHIARLKITENKIVGEERLLESEGERFRDLTLGLDGAIYAITDGGKLYKIGKK